MKSKGREILTVLGIVFSLAMALPAQSLYADSNNSVNIFPPDSAPYGRTYAEWMAAWQQWATSIPATAHPLFDSAPASTGQSGPVFFLGGKFCALNDSNCGTNNVVRHITVPAGKALFFPIADTEISTVETGGGSVDSPNAIKDINALRQAAEQNTNYDTKLSLEVDGVRVRDLAERFRVQSTAFGFYLPENDIFTAVGEGTFSPGYYFPGVDDGYYVMLQPLSPGRQHTIHFRAEAPHWNWVLDITYFVQVHR
jgi:hypothetical protein